MNTGWVIHAKCISARTMKNKKKRTRTHCDVLEIKNYFSPIMISKRKQMKKKNLNNNINSRRKK